MTIVVYLPLAAWTEAVGKLHSMVIVYLSWGSSFASLHFHLSSILAEVNFHRNACVPL